MTTEAFKIGVLTLLLACAGVADAQEAQQAERDAEAAEGVAGRAEQPDLTNVDPLSTTPVDEEVVVRGQRTRRALRMQIEMAEEAFFNRFNEINSDDEFDIVCRNVVEIGSRVPRRKCEPNFWRAAQTDFARDTVISMQGGYGANPQQAIATGFYKNMRLKEEMRELAASDKGLRDALARLVTLQQAYQSRED